MKLTLITVTCNSAETLKETINSVREQQVKELEYIVVDGGSTDETVKLLLENNDVVTKWISEPDKGIYDAMNKGLKMASGEVIGFLHADDRFAESDILKDIIKNFDNTDIDLLYGNLEYISTTNPRKVLRYWNTGGFSVSKLKYGWMPPHPTVYFKRDYIEKIGSFNSLFVISADYDWMLRCLIQPGLKVYYLQRVMVQMRVGGVSNKNISNIIKKSIEDYRVLQYNHIGGVFTLVLKNFRKIPQFFIRNRE